MSVNHKISCNTSISAQLMNDAKELKLSPSAIVNAGEDPLIFAAV